MWVPLPLSPTRPLLALWGEEREKGELKEGRDLGNPGRGRIPTPQKTAPKVTESHLMPWVLAPAPAFSRASPSAAIGQGKQ